MSELVDPSEPSETPVEVETSLDYLRRVYDVYKAPDGPGWDTMEPRVKKYLEHLFTDRS